MAFQIGFLFNLKHKITLFYLLSFVFIRFMTRCHSLSLIVIFSYSLLFAVICCHLLYHSLWPVISFVVICCTTRYHSLYHYLSFVVPLVVIRYHSLSNFKNNYFKKHQRTSGSSSSYILHRKLNKIIQEADWPSRLAFCLIWNIKSLYFTYSHSYSFVLWLAVIRCHPLSFFLTRCHSLSLAIPLVVTRCIIRCHLLYHSIPLVVPLLVICCTTRCHSLSLVVFDVTRCTTRLSFNKRSLFYNFLLFTSFIIKAKTKKKILSLKSDGDNYLKIK